MENTDKINSFETSTGELNSIIKYRADKLEKHFGYLVPPYPEELLNMSGYMSMDMQNMERAKMYFEFSIEYYPNSANAYDSISDYYKAINDLDNAIKYLQKAVDLSDNSYFSDKLKELNNN